jgi:phosphopentomutase
MTQPNRFNRITLIVLDSLGMGEMPDAADWGDAGSDTLGHILETREVRLPNLQAHGLGNTRPLQNVPPATEPRASYGRCALRSNGKDTTTGHWEMAGIILERAFPTYPHGFPPRIITRFIEETNVPGILGNVPASGTEIIKELGEEHVRTGKPIVYTSADSVFQIAAHESIIPVPRLYEICETARRILKGEDEVGRVIARPFEGEAGAFRRTENRHDYAVPPPRENLLVALSEAGLDVVCIGKVASSRLTRPSRL